MWWITHNLSVLISCCLEIPISTLHNFSFLSELFLYSFLFVVSTDAGREEDSDLTETESEPAPVEPVIVKPLPQSGHEDPQPSTSSSSFHFYNMPLSTCSGNYGPHRICTFVQVALIKKLLLYKCKCNGFFLAAVHLCIEFFKFTCYVLHSQKMPMCTI